MGEATYYILARFTDENVAHAAYEKFQELNRQGVMARDFWQQHRDMKDGAKFFEDFNTNFPLVAEYLRDLKVRDHNNGLAGLLNFIDASEEGGGYISLERRLDITGSDYVWYGADWQPMAEWLVKHGAEKVEWMSDAVVDLMELLRYRIADDNLKGGENNHVQ